VKAVQLLILFESSFRATLIRSLYSPPDHEGDRSRRNFGTWFIADKM